MNSSLLIKLLVIILTLLLLFQGFVFLTQDPKKVTTVSIYIRYNGNDWEDPTSYHQSFNLSVVESDLLNAELLSSFDFLQVSSSVVGSQHYVSLVSNQSGAIKYELPFYDIENYISAINNTRFFLDSALELSISIYFYDKPISCFDSYEYWFSHDPDHPAETPQYLQFMKAMICVD